MGAAIFALAAALVIGGLAALLNAINLIPTDIGLTWLQIGFTLLSSGLIVLAIGMAARMFGQSRAMHATSRTEPALPDWSNLPPGEDTKIPAISVPEAPRMPDLAKAGIIAGAGVAAGAVIGSALSTGEKTAEPTKDYADEFERDLFAELPEKPLPEEVEHIVGKDNENLITPDQTDASKIETDHIASVTESVATLPEPELESRGDKADEDDKAEEAKSVSDSSTSPAMSSSNSDDAGVLINLDDFELPPLPPILQPAQPPVPDNLKGDHVDAANVPEAASATTEPATSDVPGLIADADLEALSSDEPVLAPLETLDVVGAYDSGGTRFTMYSDGSVTAVGPTMDRRFVSLDALRKFIDGGAE